MTAKRKNLKIPVSQLVKQNLTIYEALVLHLKEKKKLSFHEVGILLHRDERNIWTVYHRALKKR